MNQEKTKEYWKNIFRKSTKLSLKEIIINSQKKLNFVEKEVSQARYLAAKELLREKQ